MARQAFTSHDLAYYCTAKYSRFYSVKDDHTLRRIFAKKYLDILTYPTCKFQSVKTRRVSNHLRIPILVLKVGNTKFLYLEYKTTNNPSIKETQMQPLFFVYIFVVRTQKKPHKRQLRKPVGMLTSHPSSLQDVYMIYITVSVYSCPRHYTY